MPSFDVINYSLRPSKSIERHLVFEGVARLRDRLNIQDLAYVGFGSIWFTDFVLAHKMIGITDMASIEVHEIGFKRALFNAPYATVRVLHGHSSTVLPELARDPALQNRPWLIWLDYDYQFDETLKSDIEFVIEHAYENSILLITFNGHEMSYGAAPERLGRLRDLFGAAVPDDLPKRACREERMQETLADLALNFMQSTANDRSRPGGFVPAFRLVYRDGAPMVTVGGVLPAPNAEGAAAEVVAERTWACRPAKPIVAPHLTLREAAVLQSCLPRATPLGRDDIRALGFDLESEQIEAFENYYRQYPAFAQIVA